MQVSHLALDLPAHFPLGIRCRMKDKSPPDPFMPSLLTCQGSHQAWVLSTLQDTEMGCSKQKAQSWPATWCHCLPSAWNIHGKLGVLQRQQSWARGLYHAANTRS